MNKTSGASQDPPREQAEKVKTQAWEVVALLKRAHELMSEDNAVQPATEHLKAALREAEGRASMLEDWLPENLLLTRKQCAPKMVSFREDPF